MQRTDGGIRYSPTDLVRFSASPFAAWMDRKALDDDKLAPDPPDYLLKILAADGERHERDHLAALRARGLSIAEPKTAAETASAIKQGVDVLYQARLELDPFIGIADFLRKTPAGHYEVADTKLARSPKPAYLIQLCAYAEMLEALQGRRPDHLHVVLGTNETCTFRTVEFFYYYLALKRAFLQAMDAFDPAARPDPVPRADHGRWSSHAEAWFESVDHLSRVARISAPQIKRLRSGGIGTMTALAASAPSPLQEQAALQLASKETLKCRILPEGLALLPAPSPHDLLFDIEGYPLVADGLEYLFGIVDGSGYSAYWGHDAAAERDAFERVVDRLHAAWKADPAMHIYHYANYEVTVLKRLAGRHASREAEVDDLLRNRVFVDVYTIVRKGIVAGVSGYGLKQLEPLYQAKRTGAVSKATDSIAAYHQWRVTGDGAVLQSIADYNEADCRSLGGLIAWFRAKGIPPAPPLEPKPTPPAAAIAGTGLLAQLIDFHKREQRPMWWRKFERDAMTDDELIQDGDCLGGLAWDGRDGRPIARSQLFRYRAPDQETTLEVGSDVWVAGQEEFVSATIEAMERGWITVRFSLQTLSRFNPRGPIALMPNEYLSAAVIEDAIRDVAAHPSPALEDFLARRKTDACLVIQGPPGSGKTTKAAEMIRELVAQGRAVGVTANSHKAIVNLMKACKLRGVKVGEKDSADLDAQIVGSAKDAPVALLTGGTAHCFCAEEFKGRLDTLFVDEAGQVSLANLAGMSRAAKRLVLLGDPMQLAQPLQGTHPGESGKSTLEYFLDGRATIPPDKGLFLERTHRLHPSICTFISDMVYEGRLQPAPETAARVIKVSNGKRVTVEAGIVYVPVVHEGNSRASREEVSVVKEVVGELIGREKADGTPVTAADILVVTPFNKQMKWLQGMLPGMRVGTVDKFQGQEAAIVIVSMAASDASSSSRGANFLLDLNRLNVALSRAQSLAVVVASATLLRGEATNVEQMRLLNAFARVQLSR